MILKVLGLPAATELIHDQIQRQNTQLDCCRFYSKDVIKSGRIETDRALAIGHYAGYAALDDKRSTLLCGRSFQPISCALRHEHRSVLCRHQRFPADNLILDSCYSGAATRTDQAFNRTAELVASIGPQQKALGNWSTMARLPNKTFTSRLADDVARVVGRGASSIRLRETLSATLRRQNIAARTECRSTHQLKAGGSLWDSHP